MPVTLGRDVRPCARSISWSPPGFSPNSGCLLAVCTVEGRVKIYRSPYCEYRAEWVEVVDISDILHNYHGSINFGETKDFFVTSSQDKTKKGSIKESGSNNIMDNTDVKKLPNLKKSMLSRKLPPSDNLLYFPVTYSQDKAKEGSINESGFSNTLDITDSLDIRKSRTSTRKMEINYGEFIEEEPANNKDDDYHSQNSEENYDEDNDDEDDNSDYDEDDVYDDSIPTKKIKLSMNKGSSLNHCSISKPALYAKKLVNGQQNRREKDASDLISTKQCASRISLLSSLIVAWSPTLKLAEPIDKNINNFSILAIGGKSGNVSFWKISEPRCYTIEHGRDYVDPVLIGIIQAHSSWITAISWGVYAASSSKAKLVLATGSCDGSVKLWLGVVEDLIQSLEINNDIFSLLRVVTDVTSVPVSTISLMAPSTSTNTVLAVGRGSGSLEIYLCGITSEEFENMGVYDAHKQAVTGLTWTVDGCRLYSCSQDNSLCCWLLHERSLREASFPLNFPGIKNSLDLSAVLDLCFGIALSPGGLVAAVVRSFDSKLLNQMYQARIQKAAVEFYWTGAHSLQVPSNKQLISCIKENPKFSEKDLVCWQSAILWSLKHFEFANKPLVLWDNLTALLLFLKSSPLFVKNVLFKWVSSWSLGSLKSVTDMENIIPKLSTRKIHLLNIICRRLMLSELNELEGEVEREKAKSWNSLLANCEREIQERFLAFTFKVVLLRASYSNCDYDVENWSPVGVAQMKKWVDVVKPGVIHDQLKLLGSDIGKLKSRVQLVCEYRIEEECCYCSAPVPFETTDVAECKGSTETHELARCAVSMKLCSVTAPMWFCTCCRRQVFHLPPLSFFTMTESPLDVDFEKGSFALEERSIPWCIFCGILLQRILPDFLLSASPV